MMQVSERTVELTAKVASDRIAGMKFKEIADHHAISVPMVRHYLKRAMKTGVATPEAIHFKPNKPRARQTVGEYNAIWVRRILDTIQIDLSGCWIYQGTLGSWGYSSLSYRGKNVIGHRKLYEVLHGVSLERWQLVMHTCDMPACMNPGHHQVGTPKKNVQDAADKGRHHNVRKTECKRGHEFTPENTNIKPNGARECKICCSARFRIARGWPEDLAYSIGKVPRGFTVDFTTGQFTSAKGLKR
jgi:hypothetical protein